MSSQPPTSRLAHFDTPDAEVAAFAERELVNEVAGEPVRRDLLRGADFAFAVEWVFRDELPAVEIPVVIQVVAVARPGPGTLEVQPAGQVPLRLHRQTVVLVAGAVGDILDVREDC